MSARIDVQHPPVLRRGKAAYRASVAAAGGQEEAAAATGRSQQRISLYGHPNSDAFAPMDVMIAQEAVAHGSPGFPHIARFFAREAGYELFRLPDAKALPIRWGQLCATLTKEHSDVIASVCAALDRDGVSAAEARACLAELDEDLQARMQLRAALLAVLEDE